MKRGHILEITKDTIRKYNEAGGYWFLHGREANVPFLVKRVRGGIADIGRIPVIVCKDNEALPASLGNLTIALCDGGEYGDVNKHSADFYIVGRV